MNKIINKLIVMIVLSNHPLILVCQGTFDVIPVTDGQQSQLYDVYADSNFIYVIGDLQDTSIALPGQTFMPWWGVFDYNGTLGTKKTLFNENLTNYIGVYGSRIIKNLNDKFIYVPIIYNDNGFAQCLVLEIEPSSGNIIRHNIIGNPFDPSSYVIPRWVTFNPFDKRNMLLATNLEIDEIQRQAIFSMDRNLHVIQTILIEDNGRDNYNSYMEKESDSTYLLIGDSRKRNDHSEASDIKPFFMRVNAKGEILTFNLAQGIPDKSVGFFLSENMSVVRDVNGNWIFGALSFFPGWYSLPYVFSYDSEFKNMNWAINFSTEPNSTEQQHHLFGADYDEISRTYVVVGSDNYQNDNYIIKANDAGDSLWTRHFIPLNWKPEDVGFVSLLDVKATPYHSYVSVGKAVSRPNYIAKSWAILIDSFGCIIPGCQNTVSISEISAAHLELFSIYPNPANTFVGFLCNQEINSKVRVSFFDLSGSLIESVSIYPTLGYQYLLNVSDWMSGMYILRIDSIDGKLLQTAQIIVN